MDDQKIIDLYWIRSEQAITETDIKYGALCRCLAYNILNNREDMEESVNDTYLAAWNAMPPHRPAFLKAFLAKITRQISIKRWRANTTAKRGGGQIPLVLEELTDCICAEGNPEELAMEKDAREALNRFLDQLPQVERSVFLRRYFLLDTAAEIAAGFGFTESKVNSMLHRTRMKLKTQFKKEGYL